MAGDSILISKVTLDNFLIFIFIFVLTIVSGNIAYSVLRRLMDDKLSLRNSKLIARVIEYSIFILGFYYGVYYVLDLDLNALVASLGILGIAVAFGSQQIIQNFIAGVLISIGRPVQLEDWVEVGDTGINSIKDITLTNTVLRNKDGRLFFMPNSLLISSIVINYTKSGFIEIPATLTIPSACDLEKVRKIIKEVIHEHANILPNVPMEEKSIISKLFELPHIKILFKDRVDMTMFEPRVLISGISDSRTTLSIRFWIREIDKKDEIISEFFEELFKRFKNEKIDLKEGIDMEDGLMSQPSRSSVHRQI